MHNLAVDYRQDNTEDEEGIYFARESKIEAALRRMENTPNPTQQKRPILMTDRDENSEDEEGIYFARQSRIEAAFVSMKDTTSKVTKQNKPIIGQYDSGLYGHSEISDGSSSPPSPQKSVDFSDDDSNEDGGISFTRTVKTDNTPNPKRPKRHIKSRYDSNLYALPDISVTDSSGLTTQVSVAVPLAKDNGASITLCKRKCGKSCVVIGCSVVLVLGVIITGVIIAFTARQENPVFPTHSTKEMGQ